jgi:hypothetical protein
MPVSFWRSLPFVVRPPSTSLGIGVGHNFDDAVNGKSSGSKGSDIPVTGDAGPVFFEDAPAIRVGFTKRHRCHSGPFKAEGKSADPAKEIEDAHGFIVRAGAAIGGRPGAATTVDRRRSN